MPAPEARPADRLSSVRLGLALAALTGATAVGALLAWHSLTDLDIWFHLRAGLDLVRGAGFPHTNTYSFVAPDHPWLNHEWLYQLIVAPLAPTGDPSRSAAAWNLLRSVLILLLLGLLAAGTHPRRLLDPARAGSVCGRAMLLLGILTLLWPRFNLRPELLSYLALVLLVRWTDAHFGRPAPRQVARDPSLWRLFALVVVWVQCHGFATFAPFALGLAALLHPLDRRPGHGESWPAAARWTPALLGVVALGLTPNLWHGLVFPVRALAQFRGEGADLTGTVSELVPLLQTPNALGLTLTAFKIGLGVGVAYALLAGRALSPWRLVLFGLAALAALANQRSLAVFGLALFLLLEPTADGAAAWPAAGWRQRVRWDRWSRRASVWLVPAGSVLVLAVAAWWAHAIVTNDFYLAEGVGRRFGSGTTPATYPVAAAAGLTGETGARTFANLDAAAYLLGCTPARTWIDGRTEAFPASAWRDYRTLRGGGPGALSLLAQNQVTAVALALRSGAFTGLAADLLGSPAWQLAAADAAGVLFLPAAANPPRTQRSILAAAAAATLAASGPDRTRRADFALAAAGLHDLAGDEDGARRALDTGLDARPDHPALNHNLGNRLLAAGEFAAARDHFRRALAVNGRLAGSALNAGVCSLRLGERGVAIGEFRRAVAIDAGQVGGWVNLAVALKADGDTAGAIKALEKATALRPGDARLQDRLRQWRMVR